jgi:hypothetical protein
MGSAEDFSRDLATALYRTAARVSAGMLASSPAVESILLHRSAATGEVSFGRSDIDMVLIVAEREAENGASIASLCRTVCRTRLLNPALNHIEVYEPSGFASHALMDTFWGSLERRSQILLRGKPVDITFAPVDPDHALGRFLLWVEWFFANSVQRRNQRNIRKTALESWNAYATAEGLIREPYLLRSEMETQASRFERDLITSRLCDPSYAVAFVFGLADRLHCSRLAPLRTLEKPLVFEAITAPLGLQRVFVVLPRPDSPLPPETFVPGAFPCTPEILHLFAHEKNAFLYWALPSELLDLGMRPPTVSAFLRSCRHYSHSRFLFCPGFADPRPSTEAARMAVIRHAVNWLSRGELPPAIPQEEIRQMMAAGQPIAAYYRTLYRELHSETRRLQESLRLLTGVTSRS